MGRNNEIAQLLEQYFGNYNFLGPKPQYYPTNKLKCCQKKKCKVREDKEPIWTPRFGDENTDVMIVAEAPSSAGGPGLHVGGLLSECPKDAKSPLHKLKKFVEDSYETTPYFTNLVKCGVAKQEKRVKHKLETRAKTCVTALLLGEIQIMKPRIILCVGALAWKYLEMYQSELKQSGISPEVHQLTHYGHQAALHLDIDDKVRVIWRCEAGLTRPEEVSLSKLSHFKSRRPKR